MKHTAFTYVYTILKRTPTSVLTKHRESVQYTPIISCQHPHFPPHLKQLFKSWGINFEIVQTLHYIHISYLIQPVL